MFVFLFKYCELVVSLEGRGYILRGRRFGVFLGAGYYWLGVTFSAYGQCVS